MSSSTFRNRVLRATATPAIVLTAAVSVLVAACASSTIGSGKTTSEPSTTVPGPYVGVTEGARRSLGTLTIGIYSVFTDKVDLDVEVAGTHASRSLGVGESTTFEGYTMTLVKLFPKSVNLRVVGPDGKVYG